MGDHASRGPTPAGAFAVMWQKRGMKTEWKRVVEKDKYGRKQMDRKKTRSMESKRWTLLWGGTGMMAGEVMGRGGDGVRELRMRRRNRR